MTRNIRIHDICRTERYYTATLLPYVLLHETFAGLRAFLGVLKNKDIHAISVQTGEPIALNGEGSFAHVELISEMGLVRDVRFYSPWLEGLEDIKLENAERIRPDLVIIADGLLIVIEAKFFQGTNSKNKIHEQIRAQREVIKKIVLPFPGYSFDGYCHLFLSAAPAPAAETIGCQGILYWEEMKQLAEQVLGREHYVTQRLIRATEMYKLVSKTGARGNRNTGNNYCGKPGLTEMKEKCKQEGNKVMVGYNGGERKLQADTREYLEGRRFKWDWADDPIPPKVPRNWIPGNRFLELIMPKFPDQ
jgi:hypothetical protein